MLADCSDENVLFCFKSFLEGLVSEFTSIGFEVGIILLVVVMLIMATCTFYVGYEVIFFFIFFIVDLLE